MTMSRGARRWSIASAKAELSRLVDEAQQRPLVIERRGKPVAMLVAIEQYEEAGALARWNRFLELSLETRRSGGGDIRIDQRVRRRSPLRGR
jgi:prevent-host-death family protein